MFKRIFLAATLLIASGFIAKQAFAITMIPPTHEFDVTPEQQYSTIVKLFNEEERELVVYSSVTNFGQQGETGIPTYDLNVPSTEGLASWITVGKGPFTIQPGERIEIPITINPPVNAEPGGHYTGIFFTEKNPAAQGSGQIGVSKGVGILLLARVAGDIVESGQIKEFVTDQKSYKQLPVQFSLRYENTGNVHVRPTGKINITDMLGRAAGSIDVNPTKGATLPKAIRKYEAVWEKSQSTPLSGSAWNQFWQSYKNEYNNFALGKYTAVLTLTAGKSSQVQTNSEITFWVCPWHILIVYLVALIVIILLLWLLIRKYNRWLTKKVLSQQNQPTPVSKPKIQSSESKTGVKK